MTKEEIRRLAPAASPRVDAPPAARSSRPVPSTGVREFFMPGAAAAYEPRLYGSARVSYVDAERGIDTTQEVNAVTQFGEGAVTVDWHGAQTIDVSPDLLLPAPAANDARYVQPPADAMEARSYAAWQREFERWVSRSHRLRVFSAPRTGLSSLPGESERDFRIRLQQAQRERRDADVEKLRAKYAPRLSRLAERVAKAQESVAKERDQAGQQKLQSAVSIGATVLGAFLGRKAMSASTLGRATTAARGISRTAKETGDIARAEARTSELQEELAALEAELQREIDSLAVRDEPIETVEITPKRGAVDVRLVALVWTPSSA